jgi:hypothetical protein
MSLRWPNLFIVGAAKAGTTSLYHYLKQHPDIFMSSFKEPKYFSTIDPAPELKYFVKFIADEASYLKLFAEAGQEAYRGEASTSYLWDPEAPARIKAASPEARIIIILREPVSRSFSHYLNDVREGIEKRSFPEAIAADLQTVHPAWGVTPLYIELGRYPQQVRRYLDLFGPRVSVYFFEELIRDVPTHLTHIFNFLELDPRPAQQIVPEIHNTYAKPRNEFSSTLIRNNWARTMVRTLFPEPWRKKLRQFATVQEAKPLIDPETKQLLHTFYAPEVVALGQLLQTTPPW